MEDTRPAPLRVLEDWVSDPTAVLESGQFSDEARVHYEMYGRYWITWCTAAGEHPYDIDRLRIKDWADETFPGAVRTRAAAVSAVKAFYARLLALEIADGVEHTRRHLAGAVPHQAVRTGLDPDTARRLLSAADRLRGRDAERDRAIVYLLLNHFLGGEGEIRPGQIIAMRLEGRVREQHRLSWKMPQKNAATEATVLQGISRDGALALDDYLPHRIHVPERGSWEDRGPLFTVSQRGRGSAIQPGKTIRNILARITDTHPDLTRLRLTPDDVAHTRRPATAKDDDI